MLNPYFALFILFPICKQSLAFDLNVMSLLAWLHHLTWWSHYSILGYFMVLCIVREQKYLNIFLCFFVVFVLLLEVCDSPLFEDILWYYVCLVREWKYLEIFRGFFVWKLMSCLCFCWKSTVHCNLLLLKVHCFVYFMMF